MRLNKFFLATVIALSATLLSSCLKDQEDIFDEPASQRLQAQLDKAKSVLTSSEYGWAFDYYPDRNISYGSYVYTAQFTNNDVTIGCELDPGNFETSLYKLTNDNGPVLSFDSYNTLMHFFATPSGSGSGPGGYQGYDGDFEFIIMNITDNLITLRGNRTGNTMYMHRLEQDAASYIAAAYDMGESMFLTSLDGTLGETAIHADVYLGERYMEFSWGEGDDDLGGSYYIPTPTGLRFLEPVDLPDGATISAISFDASTLVYSGVDSKERALSMTGELPETYAKFDEYVGEYTLKYYKGNRTLNVTLEPDKANNRFLIKGLSAQFDVVATYDKSNGCIEINSQQVGVSGDNYFWFCGWALDPDTGSGSFSWSTSCGVRFVKDPSNPGTFLFANNDYTNTQANSFIVYQFTGAVSSSGATGQAKSPWTLTNGSAQLVYLHSLVKK